MAVDFCQSYLVPPPSTAYGFLLSMVGETDFMAYAGASLAIQVESLPEVSTIVRRNFRWKDKKARMAPANRAPKKIEVLRGLNCRVYLNHLELEARVQNAIAHPETVDRFGALSLGESKYLVNAID
jgi:CRISPR-associated protein Cas5t